MAAAHVSALVARIVEANPRADVHAVREALIRECTRRVDVEDDALNLDRRKALLITAPNNTQLPAAQSNRVSNER